MTRQHSADSCSMLSELKKQYYPLRKTVDAVISGFNALSLIELSVSVRNKNMHVCIKNALMEKDMVHCHSIRSFVMATESYCVCVCVCE